MDTHLTFGLHRRDIKNGILIPKYYDPDLIRAQSIARESGYDVVSLGELLEPGERGSRLGDWVRREHYGTGEIPYVRTSDLNQWLIRPDYKKGVSDRIYEGLRARQDVRPNDILFVAHGTYLVGTVAIVLRHAGRLVIQDHVYRLRLRQGSGIQPELLLAMLSTKFVRQQVRARQFSADIIDKIGDRHLGLALAIPADVGDRANIVRRVRRVLASAVISRRKIRQVATTDLRMVRERATSHYGFAVTRSAVRNRILIPKYYDPDIEADLAEEYVATETAWVSIGELVRRGVLTATTGIEVGKMAYGTGDVSFIRTSDIAEWEVKSGVRHGVSEEIYSAHKSKASVEEGDVLVVRDGTYLVGSSAIVTAEDLPGLICGGLFRLRSLDHDVLSPYALLAFLNLPIVRRQMRARQFTRDVIDTLGNRLLEIRVPDPDSKLGRRIGAIVRKIVAEKIEVKREIAAITSRLEPPIGSAIRGRPGWSMR